MGIYLSLQSFQLALQVHFLQLLGFIYYFPPSFKEGSPSLKLVARRLHKAPTTSAQTYLLMLISYPKNPSIVISPE